MLTKLINSIFIKKRKPKADISWKYSGGVMYIPEDKLDDFYKRVVKNMSKSISIKPKTDDRIDIQSFLGISDYK